jgi:hypothetical protein
LEYGWQLLTEYGGTYMPAGEHSIFSACLQTQLSGNTAGVGLTERKIPLQEHSLKKGPLSLVFRQGKVFLWWEKILLTKSLHLYTVFAYLQQLLNSTQALWRVRATKDEIFAALVWNNMRVMQAWRLRLISVTEVSLRVTMDIHQPGVHALAAGFMLDEMFDRWQPCGNAGNNFPEQFQPGAWEQVWTGREAVSFCAARPGIPRVVFQVDNTGAPTRTIVENSDALYHCRLVRAETVFPGTDISGPRQVGLEISLRFEG